jgi:multidrug efflux system membrane fusion protein
MLATAVVLAGCSRKPPEPVQTPPPVVIVANPVVQTVSDYEDFAGRTEAYKVVELKARVTGHLRNIFFKDGQDIEQGKPLFEIDDLTYRAQLAQAQAALVKADNRLKTATDTYAIVDEGFKGGTEGKEKYLAALGAKQEAESDVKSARAAVELASTNLRFCRVYAPFDGRLSRSMVDEENLVKADETLLTNIVRLDEIYATFDVDEQSVLRRRKLIQRGSVSSSRSEPLTVRIGQADDDDFPLSGLVVFSDNQLDSDTGTLRIRALVHNQKIRNAPLYMLSPGQFVRVRVPLGAPRTAVLVPEKAIGSDQGQRFVFVVNAQNTVERRNVIVGQQYGQNRVIETAPGDKTVTPSDRVIVEGLLRVRQGAEVNPKQFDVPKEKDKGKVEPKVERAEAPAPRER